MSFQLMRLPRGGGTFSIVGRFEGEKTCRNDAVELRSLLTRSNQTEAAVGVFEFGIFAVEDDTEGIHWVVG